MTGRWGILAIVLALAGQCAQAQTTAVPDPPPSEVHGTAAPARILDPVLVDGFIASRTRTITFHGCAVTAIADCTVTAFMPEPADTECHYSALVTDKIIAAPGEPAYVHLTRLVVAVQGRKAKRGLPPNPVGADEVAVTAAAVFPAPGLHKVCFRRRGTTERLAYDLYRAPEVDAEGKLVLPDDGSGKVTGEGGSTAVLGGLIGGIIGIPAGEGSGGNGVLAGAALGGMTAEDPARDRLPYFDRPFRSFAESVGCTITGCPERLAVRVTVRGGRAPLPILQGNRPTDYSTNATIMVPRGQLGTLAVRYPDGTVRKVMSCSKLNETRVSASFLCDEGK